jgi:hypothetical protein
MPPCKARDTYASLPWSQGRHQGKYKLSLQVAQAACIVITSTLTTAKHVAGITLQHHQYHMPIDVLGHQLTTSTCTSITHIISLRGHTGCDNHGG